MARLLLFGLRGDIRQPIIWLVNLEHHGLWRYWLTGGLLAFPTEVVAQVESQFRRTDVVIILLRCKFSKLFLNNLCFPLKSL